MFLEHQLDPKDLAVELTEDTLHHTETRGVPDRRSCAIAGCRLYMDDFGSGHSSISSLHRFDARLPEDRPLALPRRVAARPGAGAGPFASSRSRARWGSRSSRRGSRRRSSSPSCASWAAPARRASTSRRRSKATRRARSSRAAPRGEPRRAQGEREHPASASVLVLRRIVPLALRVAPAVAPLMPRRALLRGLCRAGARDGQADHAPGREEREGDCGWGCEQALHG